MTDDTPIIYGLEFQSRALSAQNAETDVVRFFIGTQSLKFENQVHQLEYDEESNSIIKTVFHHPAGEIWHLASSPQDPDLLSTCYNQVTGDGKCEMSGAIWRLNYATNQNAEEQVPTLEHVADLGTEFKSILWEPSSGKRLIGLSGDNFNLFDVGEIAKPLQKMCVREQRQTFTSAAWNPHHNCNIVAAAVDTSIRSWDLRTSQVNWSIEGAHGQLVRSIDFNPNKQYYLATCGDDCQTKFWDSRKSKEPLLSFSHHSHWVWSVRYNTFHDQLVLTSSSDARVILARAASVSSEPCGHIVDEEEDPSRGATVEDEVVSAYEEHEDSVYAVEWSAADPWLFASLSYDGRLVINKVPRSEKYRILL